MKIYISKINESWIIDRLKREWIQYNKAFYTSNRFFSDIVWLIAPWAVSESFIKKISRKKIVSSIYHIDENPESSQIGLIKKNDKYIDAYHTISIKTKHELSKLTKKPIYYIPFWVNQNIWYQIDNKDRLRTKYNFHENEFLVGSFQRDTESSDMKSPKLIKGPDIFIKLLETITKTKPNLKVVLAGNKRNYVISELERLKIPYKYFEMMSFEELNELYNILDLYLVTSRLEGGPQAIVECGLIKTPIISTDVGIADQILSSKSIFDFNDLNSFKTSTPDVNYAFENALKLTIPSGMDDYINMFKEVYEN